MGGAVAMCDPSDLGQNRLLRNRTLTEFVHIFRCLAPVGFVVGEIVTIAAIPQIDRCSRKCQRRITLSNAMSITPEPPLKPREG